MSAKKSKKGKGQRKFPMVGVMVNCPCGNHIHLRVGSTIGFTDKVTGKILDEAHDRAICWTPSCRRSYHARLHVRGGLVVTMQEADGSEPVRIKELKWGQVGLGYRYTFSE